jgi:membrane-bound serine protease (ClpP class)
MRIGLALFLGLCALRAADNVPGQGAPAAGKKVFILPIRDDIMPPLVYLVRRGVKEAMDSQADLLVLDMDTNGGRVDVTEEIIDIIGKFKGRTVTFVNRKAFSAGAFISVATQSIYMAPQSVIGAAAPIILSPGGGGVEKTPETFEAKMTSGVSALVRTRAEKNGYNIAVVEKMIDKSKELKIDGEVLNEKGQILTLTNLEAEKEYGQPPKRLLSSGTVESLDDLLKTLGYGPSERHVIKATGVEKLGTWINAISPLLLIIGVVGIYIEFKTPGFGLPGIVGIAAFAVYFLGGYVAGLSGMEWLLVFILGLALVAIELFVFPGTIALGMIGVVLMLASIIMALVDMYPGMPAVPTLPALRLPLETLVIAFLGSAIGVAILSRILPRTPMYRTLVSHTASGMVSELAVTEHRTSVQGQVGVAISNLRPGGKAQFGDQVLDVISQGDMVAKGRKVKIIGHSGREAVVAVVD